MSDIFQEVEEDLRRERARQAWDKYGIYVVAAAVLIVVVVGGWRGYEWYQRQQAEAAGARFQGAIELMRAGKAAEAQIMLTDLAQKGSSGYRLMARFRLAGEAGKTNPAEGAKAFDALAGDTSIDAELRDLARVRAGILLVDTAPYAEAAARLESLAAGDNPWRHVAREMLGLSAWRAGDMASASRWFEAAIGDPAIPDGVRQRVQKMLELVASQSQ